ncbi:hypothetical protein D1007_27234 [Hordeum vulgare]|nr:hypothetical protein D1007_27234 [Hordeum vulgare]
MVVLLPGRDLIMVSLTKLAFHAHGIGPDDPSPFSSDDGGDSESYDVHDAAIREATLREWRPAGSLHPHHFVCAFFGCSSRGSRHLRCPLRLHCHGACRQRGPPGHLQRGAIPSCVLNVAISTTLGSRAPAPRATDNAAVYLHLIASVGSKAVPSSSAVISNLDVHDNIIRKRVVHSQCVVFTSKLRRSACITNREMPFYSTVAQKASRLKNSRFNLAKASDELVDVVYDSFLFISEGEASDADDAAVKLAHIALVSRGEADEADAIHATGALPSP